LVAKITMMRTYPKERGVVERVIRAYNGGSFVLFNLSWTNIEMIPNSDNAGTTMTTITSTTVYVVAFWLVCSDADGTGVFTSMKYQRNQKNTAFPNCQL
jgi:hypothetical protein